MSKGWVKGLVIILVIVVLGGVIYGLYFSRNKRANSSAAGTVNYLKAKVTRGDIEVNISSTGSASSSATQNVTSTVSGTIESIAQVGDTVSSGTAIATISGTSVTSPISGVITAVNVKVADNVKYGGLLVTVADTTKMQVIASVDETDIARVSAGQNAKISFDALPGKTFDGQVTKVSGFGQSSNNVTTYDVTISITNPKDIKIGMSATVTIPVASKKGVLVVPVEAIRSQNGKSYVFVSDPNQANGRTSQEIQTGLANETSMEIVSGVKEGDTVLIPMPTGTVQKQQGFSFFGGMGGGRSGGNGGNGGSGNNNRTGANNGGGAKMGGGGQ